MEIKIVGWTRPGPCRTDRSMLGWLAELARRVLGMLAVWFRDLNSSTRLGEELVVGGRMCSLWLCPLLGVGDELFLWKLFLVNQEWNKDSPAWDRGFLRSEVCNSLRILRLEGLGRTILGANCIYFDVEATVVCKAWVAWFKCTFPDRCYKVDL